MTMRQPSIREAQQRIREIKMWLANHPSVPVRPATDRHGYYCGDGFEFQWQVGVRKPMPMRTVLRWPASDISARCHECNRIIVDRRDQGAIERISLNRENLNRWLPANRFPANEWDWAHFCLGCKNKRRPHHRMNEEWWETTKVINKTKKEIRDAKVKD